MTTFIISHTAGVESPVGREERMSLHAIAELAKGTKAPTKDALPMVIAGAFGKSRERTNQNMLSATAIMGDHDAGTMTVEQAAAKLADANVHGAIISSPRHMVPTNKGAGPRWRLIIPLAKPISILEHLELAERVNGIFGKGVLGIEGKSVSRPYYIGSIADGKPVECKVVEGRLFDECPADEFKRIRFPRSACDAITFPDVNADATTAELANAILEGVKNFDAGHEGLKPACLRIAPFVRMGILSGDVVAEALQEQLAATSSRSDVPENEAARNLKWAVWQCDAVADICMPWTLGEKDVDTLAREIWAKHSDPNTDFGALDDAAADDQWDAKAMAGTYRHGQRPYGNRKWLVFGLIPDTGVGMLSGQWGAGKTFCAIDLACCLMLEKPFLGRDVDKRCSVLWIAHEGETELPDRLDAALAKYQAADSPPAPFWWRDTLPKLLDKGAVDEIVWRVEATNREAAREGLPPIGFLPIDTLAIGAGWDDENNSAEGQRAMSVMKLISKRTGAFVFPVDHYGKNEGSGTRGSSAKESAADVVLAALGDRQDSGEVKNRRLATRKVRGVRAGEEYPFELPVHVVGQDDKGRDITTCTVRWLTKEEAAARKVKADPRPPSEKAAFAVLQSMIANLDDGQGKVTLASWLQGCNLAGSKVTAITGRNRITVINKACRSLIARGDWVTEDDNGMVWINGASGAEYPAVELAGEDALPVA
jgi:hypothetical protein